MNKIKQNWIWIAAIIIIVVIGFVFFSRGEKKQSDTTAEPCMPSADGVVGINISGDSLVRMYQEISRLQAALKACTEGKKMATQTSRKSSTPAASNQTRNSSSARLPTRREARHLPQPTKIKHRSEIHHLPRQTDLRKAATR